MNRSGKTIGVFSGSAPKSMIEELKAWAEEVLVVPSVIRKPAEPAAGDRELLRRTAEQDWIVFEDAPAVGLYLERLLELGADPFDLDEIRVCTVGEAAAERLRLEQLHADVIAATRDAEKIAREISSYVFEDEGLRGLGFLIVGAAGQGTELGRVLEKEGAKVARIGIYRTELPAEAARLKALLLGGAVDELQLLAPTDVLDLALMFTREEVASLKNTMHLRPMNEAAYRALREQGLAGL